MKLLQAYLLSAVFCFSASPVAADLQADISKDYKRHLGPLFKHFHANPELSLKEFKTAERLASELKEAGFKVTEKVGGTGVVAVLENGEGPTVMLRADMDGLPVLENSGLDYASKATQEDDAGNMVPTMHACGHDVHITSLVGTARYMAKHTDDWSGRLMLIGQPAEERGAGAKNMMKDQVWKRFGQPDYALAFHVSADKEAGKLYVRNGATYSGADSVDIIVHGVGAHGASPHRGKDPVLIGSQIVLALQTIVSREIAPKEPSVITVGSFHAGSKHNVISDRAHLQLTVRNDNAKTREQLLDAIGRVALNVGRMAGLPEDKLPEVIVAEMESVPPTLNDNSLTDRLRAAWLQEFGEEFFDNSPPSGGMGAEDFGFFTTEPYIPSTYFAIGGTPAERFKEAAAGGAPVPSHHSALFKVSPEPSVSSGVAASVVALKNLMPPR